MKKQNTQSLKISAGILTSFLQTEQQALTFFLIHSIITNCYKRPTIFRFCVAKYRMTQNLSRHTLDNIVGSPSSNKLLHPHNSLCTSTKVYKPTKKHSLPLTINRAPHII
ncbi:hypothetical protein [Bartonella koehlerae]|uniref:hypothetical protein n=1 Tax=Bartonella koehlerae TaxID=92181 RepID=UPI0012B672F6